MSATDDLQKAAEDFREAVRSGKARMPIAMNQFDAELFEDLNDDMARLGGRYKLADRLTAWRIGLFRACFAFLAVTIGLLIACLFVKHYHSLAGCAFVAFHAAVTLYCASAYCGGRCNAIYRKIEKEAGL